MSLLQMLVEFTYRQETKMYFFLSPFIFAALCLVLVFVEILILNINPQDAASIIIFPAAYFFLWVFFMMFVRTKYLPRNNKLKSINYVPPEKLTDKLIDEAKRLNFEIKLGKKTPWAYAEAKIMGVIDEVPFLIERVHDPATSNTHLYHYQTFAYIKTKKKDELSITQKDIRQDLNSINNSIKKTIITNLKSELNWALNENIFITKIDFSNGSMGAVLCNEYNLAPYLKQTLELLVKIVKIYEQA